MDQIGKSGPRFSFGTKRRDSLPAIPGPQYSTTLSDSKLPVAFARSSRKVFAVQQFGPGPGSYHSLSQPRSTKGVILLGRHEQPENKVPGPGNYNVEVRERGPAFSMQSKQSIIKQARLAQKRFEVPAPNAYNPQKESVTPIKIGTSLRYDPTANKGGIPAPNSYSISQAQINKSTSSIVFGKQVRKLPQEVQQATPGPADHCDLLSWGKGPAPTLVGKSHYQPREKSPGPNQYNTSPRTFEPKPENKVKAGMSGAKRLTYFDEVAKNQLQQSPADYYSGKVGLQSQASSIILKAERKLHEVKSTPGPGEYSVSPTSKVSAATFGTERRGELFVVAATPGASLVQNGWCPEGGRVVRSQSRFTISKDRVSFPGPANYLRPEKQRGGFSFGKEVRTLKFQQMSP